MYQSTLLFSLQMNCRGLDLYLHGSDLYEFSSLLEFTILSGKFQQLLIWLVIGGEHMQYAVPSLLPPPQPCTALHSPELPCAPWKSPTPTHTTWKLAWGQYITLLMPVLPLLVAEHVLDRMLVCGFHALTAHWRSIFGRRQRPTSSHGPLRLR